jgi:RNA polymerase sigma-70 factor (ECF subfamily)
LYAHALAYLKSTQRAEEVTQDIFLKIWLHREKLAEVRNLENYLFIVARNQIVNETRRRILELYGQPEEAIASTALTPDLQTEYKESYGLLLRGIELLPEKRRQVFKMSRLEGMSNERIAAELGMHKDTVYQYITKALLFLKVYLSEHKL